MKFLPYIAAVALLTTACTPDSGDAKLGPLPEVSFTATAIPNRPHKIVVESTTPGAFRWMWYNGVSETPIGTRAKDTLTFPEAGEFVISLRAFGKGGSATASKKMTMEGIRRVDILKGGDMETGAAAHWTVLNTGGAQTSIQFAGGKLVFSNTGNSNGAIYQAIAVKKGMEYGFAGHVKGSGAQNSWFEVVIGTAQPTQGSDYSGFKLVSLNTWAGCGIAPFDRNLTQLSCSSDGDNTGIYKPDADKTIYLVIKAGSSGGTLGTGGIALDDVKFLEQEP